jgi:ABC-type multidrug transport system permease subunit
MILLILLLGSLGSWIEPDGEGRFNQALAWVYTAIGIWIPLYFLVSLKRVYGQGWGMTIAKYCLIGISYLVLLAFATAFTAVLSFVLL